MMSTFHFVMGPGSPPVRFSRQTTQELKKELEPQKSLLPTQQEAEKQTIPKNLTMQPPRPKNLLMALGFTLAMGMSILASQSSWVQTKVQQLAKLSQPSPLPAEVSNLTLSENILKKTMDPLDQAMLRLSEEVQTSFKAISDTARQAKQTLPPFIQDQATQMLQKRRGLEIAVASNDSTQQQLALGRYYDQSNQSFEILYNWVGSTPDRSLKEILSLFIPSVNNAKTALATLQKDAFMKACTEDKNCLGDMLSKMPGQKFSI